MKKLNFTALVVSAILLTSCGGNKTEEVVISKGPSIEVQVGSITSNDNQPFVTASGTVESENSANVSTRMMGYITKVHVKVGQRVSQGQLLVSINNTDLQAKKAQVEASILQAEAAYNSAKKDYERFVALFSQQSASQKELDDMTARYEMAKAGLEGAKQMKNEIQAQFAYSNITAPISGVITNTFVKEGDMANPGMPLVSVEGTGGYQVVARVSESDITSIKNGMKVKVLLKSKNAILDGKVTEVSLSATNTGGQYMVKINLDKTTTELLPGMYTTVQFPVDKKVNETDKTLIPISAVLTKGDLKGVYTVSQQNTAVLRWIRLGRTYGDQVEVLSGLNPEEKFILSADGKLFNGSPISIK